MFKIFFENTTQQVSRLPWIDYAKGIAISLVVYRHIMIGLERAGLEVNQYYILANEVVFTFRMPLFFILAGFFIRRSLAKRSAGEFIFSKFNTILYPYFIWTFIQVTIQIVLSKYTNAQRTALDYLSILYHPRALDQFWYLYALFNTAVIFLLLHKVLRGNKILLLAIALLMHQASIYFPELDLIKDALYHFLFLVIGDFISQYVLDQKNNKRISSTFVTLLLLPVFIVCQWYWFSQDRQINIFLFAIVALVGCALMINISLKLQNGNVLKMLKYVGLFSLSIYLIHVIISAGVRTIMLHVLKINNTTILIISGVFLAILISIMFYNFCMRSGMWFLFNFRKPKSIDK